MKNEKRSSESPEHARTRRDVLKAAGGLTLLGLAGCDLGSPSQPNSGQATAKSNSTPTPTAPPAPVTLAFTGDVMFGRTVNSHMLETAPNDPFPFTYTADFLRGFDLTIGNLECVISIAGHAGPQVV